MIDHLADQHARSSRAPRRPVAELLAEGLAWIFAAASVATFAIYLTSDTARQHVAPEAFIGGQP